MIPALPLSTQILLLKPARKENMKIQSWLLLYNHPFFPQLISFRICKELQAKHLWKHTDMRTCCIPSKAVAGAGSFRSVSSKFLICAKPKAGGLGSTSSTKDQEDLLRSFSSATIADGFGMGAQPKSNPQKHRWSLSISWAGTSPPSFWQNPRTGIKSFTWKRRKKIKISQYKHKGSAFEPVWKRSSFYKVNNMALDGEPCMEGWDWGCQRCRWWRRVPGNELFSMFNVSPIIFILAYL